jgi:hypothetical protein
VGREVETARIGSMAPSRGSLVVAAVLALSTISSAAPKKQLRSFRPGPTLSALAKGCTITETVGPEWRRLWLDCGCGPVRILGTESLALHVDIKTAEQAMEFLRLFSSRAACDLVPEPAWIEIEGSDEDGWFALGHARFGELCERPSASALGETEDGPTYRIKRCQVSTQDGSLYMVDQSVAANGFVVEGDRRLILRAAGLGSCSIATSGNR